MAKVQTRKAAKAYPQNGIEKGDTYYYVSIKTGPRSSRVMRSKTPFKQSQLTTSAFSSTLYAIDESLQGEAYSNGDDLKTAVETAIEELEELKSTTEENLSNMPEGLQEGDTGQMMQERIYNLETYIDELQEVVNNADDLIELEGEAVDKAARALELQAKEDTEEGLTDEEEAELEEINEQGEEAESKLEELNDELAGVIGNHGM